MQDCTVSPKTKRDNAEEYITYEDGKNYHKNLYFFLCTQISCKEAGILCFAKPHMRVFHPKTL